MNKFIYAAFLIFFIGCSDAFAGHPAADKFNYSFKSANDEVGMVVVRGKKDVALHLLVKDMSKYDHIVIERSNEPVKFYNRCKFISCFDATTEKTDLTEIDNRPYDKNANVYYRVKTITKDGIERVYPPVLLPAVK